MKRNKIFDSQRVMKDKKNDSPVLILTDEVGSAKHDTAQTKEHVKRHFIQIVRALLNSPFKSHPKAFVIKNIGDALMIRCPNISSSILTLLKTINDAKEELANDTEYRVRLRIALYDCQKPYFIEGSEIGKDIIDIINDKELGNDLNKEEFIRKLCGSRKDLSLLNGDLFGGDINRAARVAQLPDTGYMIITDTLYRKLCEDLKPKPKSKDGIDFLKQGSTTFWFSQKIAFSYLKGFEELCKHDSPLFLREIVVSDKRPKDFNLEKRGQKQKIITLIQYSKVKETKINREIGKIRDLDRKTKYFQLIGKIKDRNVGNLENDNRHQYKPRSIPRILLFGGYPDENVYLETRKKLRTTNSPHRITGIPESHIIYSINKEIIKLENQKRGYALVLLDTDPPGDTMEHSVIYQFETNSDLPLTKGAGMSLLYCGTLVGEFDYFALYELYGKIDLLMVRDEMKKILSNTPIVPSRSKLILFHSVGKS